MDTYKSKQVTMTLSESQVDKITKIQGVLGTSTFAKTLRLAVQEFIDKHTSLVDPVEPKRSPTQETEYKIMCSPGLHNDISEYIDRVQRPVAQIITLALEEYIAKGLAATDKERRLKAAIEKLQKRIVCKAENRKIKNSGADYGS